MSHVTDLYVVRGGDPVPPGYTKIDVDLNKGSSGTRLALCYKMGEQADAITGLQVSRVHGPGACSACSYIIYVTCLMLLLIPVISTFLPA